MPRSPGRPPHILGGHISRDMCRDTYPFSGHLFVFTNRLRNRVKVLFFDGSGLWVCAKRLERGTFGWPEGEGVSCSLRPEQLQLLLHGMEGTSRRRWYRR